MRSPDGLTALKFPATLKKFPAVPMKFPAFLLGNFAANPLLALGSGVLSRAEIDKIPCIFPVIRDFPYGDQFTPGCQHRHLVSCFWGGIMLARIIAKYPQVSLMELGTSHCRERRSAIAGAL
jgi:hypothetical protein